MTRKDGFEEALNSQTPTKEAIPPPSAPAPEILVQTQFVGSEKKKAESADGVVCQMNMLGSQIDFLQGLA